MDETRTEVVCEPAIYQLQALREVDERPTHESKEEEENLSQNAIAVSHDREASPNPSRKRGFIAETVGQESNPERNKKRKTSHTHKGAVKYPVPGSPAKGELADAFQVWDNDTSRRKFEGGQIRKISAVEEAQTEALQRARKKQKLSHNLEDYSNDTDTRITEIDEE